MRRVRGGARRAGAEARLRAGARAPAPPRARRERGLFRVKGNLDEIGNHPLPMGIEPPNPLELLFQS